MTAQKDLFFQGIRGVCIIAVVLIHCMTGGMFEHEAILRFNYDYWIVFRQFINFPVAIFIFLSGYFVKQKEYRKDSFDAIKRRGGRLLVPFIIWSLIYTAYNFVVQGFQISGIKAILHIITGSASGQLYFILVLIQLTILTPICIKCLASKTLNRLAFCITPLYLVALYSIQCVYKIQLPFYQTFFPAWFLFYYYGLYVHKNKEEFLQKTNLLKALAFVFLALLFSVFEAFVLKSFGLPDGFVTSQIKMSSFCYAMAVIQMMLVLHNIEPSQRFSKLLVDLGNYSYGIYYVHCIWLGLLTKGIAFLPVIRDILPLCQIIEAGLAIALSYGFIRITIKIMGEKKSRLLLGF